MFATQMLFLRIARPEFFGPVSGRTDFSRIFNFELPDFLPNFVARNFPSFLWQNCPEKSRTNATKIPDTVLRKAGPRICLTLILALCGNIHNKSGRKRGTRTSGKCPCMITENVIAKAFCNEDSLN